MSPLLLLVLVAVAALVLLAFAGSLPHDTRNCPGCEADVEKSKRRCRDCGYEFGRGS